MNIMDILVKDAVILNLAATAKDDILDEMSRALADAGDAMRASSVANCAVRKARPSARAQPSYEQTLALEVRRGDDRFSRRLTGALSP